MKTLPTIYEPIAKGDVLLNQVTSCYGTGLRSPIQHQFRKGLTSIVGDSGIGKSSLIRMIGGVLPPRSGVIKIAHRQVPRDGSESHLRFCIEKVVMVHQDQNLIEHLTVQQNVALPRWISQSTSPTDLESEVTRCLARVGLTHKSEQSVQHLSGGERQRAAIARAMVSRAPVVLADEPTGSLDPALSREIMDLLKSMAVDEGKTVIVVTHDHELAHEFSDVVLELSADGLAVLERPLPEDSKLGFGRVGA